MPTQITVDEQNEVATLAFVDSHGNETPAPAGAVITFLTSDANILAVSADPNDPQVGRLSPAGTPGNADISVQVDGAFEPDGVTPIPAPDPVTVEVDPGAAVGERLSVDQGAAPTA